MKINNKITKAISFILTIALLVFAYLYISNLVKHADFDNISLNLPQLALVILLFIAYYIFMSINWLLSCRLVQASVPNKQALAFFASQPYKYLPSSIFTFSFRAVYARKLGLGVAKSSIAQLIENANMLFANAAVFITFYAFILRPLLGVVALALILSVTGIFYGSKKFKLKYKDKTLTLNSKMIVTMFFIASVAWIVVGLSFVTLNLSLGLEVSFISFMAANTLAFSLSILAIFAPGGIGVRELVYSQFSVTGLATIAWRILTFILDFVLGGVAILIIKREFKTKI